MERRRPIRHWNPWLAAAALALAAFPPSALADPCESTVSLGVSPSLANGVMTNFVGHAAGQTFVARGTLVHAVSVWRASGSSLGYGCPLRPIFTKTTPGGTPIVSEIVAEGPEITRAYDGAHPTQFRWVFDPPLVLPSDGRYAVFFSSCGCGVELLTATPSGVEDDGSVWRTGRSGCDLSGIDASAGGALVFSIEFCEGATTTRRWTWGRLKQLYR